MKTLLKTVGLLCLFITCLPAFALISVGHLSEKEAADLGISMKYRPNGDAGVMVWLEFKKEGFLAAFTYAELQVTDAKGKHLLSARLEPNPLNSGQPREITSIGFSADPAELERCSFLIVAYGSNRGDVGYVLKVKDFLELKQIGQ